MCAGILVIVFGIVMLVISLPVPNSYTCTLLDVEHVGVPFVLFIVEER